MIDMKRLSQMAVAFLLIALGSFTGAWAESRIAVRWPAGVDQISVPLKRVGPLLTLPVSINGSEPMPFLLDTGATGVLIDRGVAEEIGLESGVTSRSHAVGGAVGIEFVRIEELAIGDVTIAPIFIATADMSGMMHETRDAFVGLIGGHFFKLMPFTIDVPAATLTFHNPAEFVTLTQQAGDALRIREHIPMVEAVIDGQARAWFKIDTGSNSSVSFSASYAAMEPILANRPWRRGLAVGLGGLARSRDIELESIALLGTELDNVEASIRVEDDVDRDTAGHIGMDLLGSMRLRFDYMAGRVWAEDTGSARPREWDRPGFDPSADHGPVTPLMLAIDLGLVEDVRAFLAAGASVDAIGPEGATSLHYAAKRGDLEIVEMLLQAGADIGVRTKSSSSTPLMTAAEFADVGVVDALIEAGAEVGKTDSYGRTALIRSASRGAVDVVKILLDAGTDPNVVSRAHGAVLHVAAQRGDVSVVELLLACGAKVDVRQSDRGTPLMLAATEGQSACVEILLNAGADFEARSQAGRTPLHYAALSGESKAVRLLLEAGADPTVVDREAKTPLDYAVRKGNQYAMLLLYDAMEQKP